MSQLPTPGGSRLPKVSGLPTIGKGGIPTPGRARLTANGTSTPHTIAFDSAGLSRAFDEAIQANDPRRKGRASDVSGSSLSPPNMTRASPSEGRRKSLGGSIAGSSRAPSARSPSVASAVSTTSSTGYTPRTPNSIYSSYQTKSPSTALPPAPPFSPPYSARPSSTRAQSRTSNADARSSSSAKVRTLETGDTVRIDSLAVEGVLCYLGKIEGKPGTYAGVELSGAFAGRGKNDGSVAGVYYFKCPPKCGVFVPSDRISALAIRPPSVASSWDGRVTPSVSDRGTPASAVRPAPPQRAVSSAEAAARAESKISFGSKASKLMNITAKQLSNRDLTSTAALPGSPRRSLGQTSSTPTSTPKPLRVSGGLSTPRSRPSLPTALTPKASRTSLDSNRNNDMPPPPVPLTRTMLPPPSPARSMRSVSVLSDASRGVAEDVGDVLFGNKNSQDRPSLMETMSPASPTPHARDIELEELRLKVLNLESQNKDLRASLLAVKVDDSSETVEKLERELETSTKKLSELEDKLHGNERTLIERQSKMDSLDRAVADAQEETKRAKSEGESRVKDVQAKLDESEALVTSLKKVIDDKSEVADRNNAQLQAKDAEIEVLQGKVARLSADLESERKELTSQVDDLRQAGQETIALYEERISEYEAQRYDMEALITSLEEQLKNSTKIPSPGELAKQASEAVLIDNETLREQVAHLNGRIQYLQEQIEEQQAAAEKEEAAVRARILRYKERDVQQKKELDDARIELDNAVKSEAAARTRIEELEEALRENAGTLENHRAEIETMRTELADLETLNASTATRGMEAKLEDAARRAANERTRLQDELAQLKEFLGAAKASKKLINDELGNVRLEAEASGRQVQSLLANVQALEQEKADLENALQVSRTKEADMLRKSTRDSVGTGTSRSGKDDNLRDQVAGLKHIVQELQKENSGHVSKIKSLENENKLLHSEAEELKEAVRTLESTLEESIAREEQALLREEVPIDPANAGVAGLQRALRESQVKYESELERLRKKMSEAEQRSNKTILELNKEVSDLESLVEVKIYREDDLEREIERLRGKLSRAESKRSSKTDAAEKEKQQEREKRPPLPPIMTTAPPESEASATICEICEQPGHDLFSCPILKDDDSSAAEPNASSSKEYCEDCESYGHTTANCPHSLDVF